MPNTAHSEKLALKLNITPPHEMRFVKGKWFLACLRVPVLFAGWEASDFGSEPATPPLKYFYRDGTTKCLQVILTHVEV